MIKLIYRLNIKDKEPFENMGDVTNYCRFIGHCYN